MLNLKRIRLVCGLRQIDVWAATGIPVGKLSQAEQGRIPLSEPEQALLVSFLHKRWKAIREAECGNHCEPNVGVAELSGVVNA